MSNENTRTQQGVKARMGPSRGLAQRSGPGTDPARARRGGDGVPGQGEVGATVGFRQRQWLSERALTFPEADICHLGRYE